MQSLKIWCIAVVKPCLQSRQSAAAKVACPVLVPSNMIMTDPLCPAEGPEKLHKCFERLSAATEYGLFS